MLRQRPISERDDAHALPFPPLPGLTPPRARALESVTTGEVVLAAPDGVGGYTIFGRFRLAEGTLVNPIFQGLAPPVIAIGEEGRDTQPYASTLVYEDNEAGIGLLYADPRRSANRVWWSTLDIRRRSQVTLLRRKRDMGRPADAAVGAVPTAGGVYNNRVWVAWGSAVRSYTEADGWTTGVAPGNRTLTGATLPTTNPVEWEGGWFWPLGAAGIDYWNGSTWVFINRPCQALVVYGGSLWGVSPTGQVFSTSTGAGASRTKIAAATFGNADVTDRVEVSDRVQGMILFTTADATVDVVPFVVGWKQMYQIDPGTYVAQPSGPQLAPHRFPMRAAVLGSDNAAYLSQGLGVTQWTGDLATPVGLDLDDGVPADMKGGIVALANGGQSLFALVDASRAEADVVLDLASGEGTMATTAGVLGDVLGFSWLVSREPGGWHTRAVADAPGSPATMLFVSEAELTYRAWFAWAGICWSITIEQGLHNPIENPTAEYEPAGSLYYSITDFTFKEAPKLALLAEVRTRRCTATEIVYPWIQYDEMTAWYPLRNADDTHGITSDGRHSFLLDANPAAADPSRRDTPPTGRANDTMQLRLDLVRGSLAATTPVVVFTALHAIKTIRPLIGWQFTIDYSRQYNNLLPPGQRDLLLRLLHANQGGLLHFAFRHDAAGPAGAADVRAAKVVRFSLLDQEGLPVERRGRATIMLSEVIAV